MDIRSSIMGGGTLNGVLLNPKQPAFSALKSARDGAGVTGDGTAATIVFDTELFDNTGGYDNTTGIFTAPVAGDYMFGTNVSALGYGAAHTYSIVSLVTTARTCRLYGTIFSAGKINSLVGGNQWDAGGTIVVPMAASATAKITLTVNASTKDILVEGNAAPSTYFWGALMVA